MLSTLAKKLHLKPKGHYTSESAAEIAEQRRQDEKVYRSRASDLTVRNLEELLSRQGEPFVVDATTVQSYLPRWKVLSKNGGGFELFCDARMVVKVVWYQRSVDAARNGQGERFEF
jgi:hypothetical protein